MTANATINFPQWLKSECAEYEQITYVPQSFSDSTHQLWHLKGAAPDKDNHFLKVCSDTDSPFWQIMQSLFDVDLYADIADFSYRYGFIDEIITLETPQLIKAETNGDDKAFILTNEIKGVAATEADAIAEPIMVKQLARYLAELHSHSHSHSHKCWGSLQNPVFDTNEWFKRLEFTLLKSAKKEGGVFLNTEKYLQQALASIQESVMSQSSAMHQINNVQQFVPMMPDLRWDQFLQINQELTALVDLDAFVFAPIELDFVIVEYLLNPDQAAQFKAEYTQFHVIPDITNVRLAYRLLLFYMGILGETDVDVWMNKELIF